MLDNFPGFEARNPEVSREVLFRNFGVTHFDCKSKEAPYFTKANWAATKYVRLTNATCTISTDMRYEAASAIRLFLIVDPRTHISFEVGGDTQVLSKSSHSAVIPADVVYRGITSGPSHVYGVRFQVSALQEIASALIGESVKGKDLADERWESHTKFASFRTAAAQFIADLDTLSTAHSFGADVLGQGLLIKFLLESSGDFKSRIQGEGASPSLLQLGRVEAYLAANCHQATDIVAISQEFGISVRSIFRYFRRLRGMTPQEFVKEQRLERARILLLNAGTFDTVTGIALQSGFHSMGHFSREYRRAYGELPSETLKRAREGRM